MTANDIDTRELYEGVREASVAWMALFGVLVGVASLVPIFPYVGGGGYVPLLVPLAAIAPLLLGPAVGITAAVIGAMVGLFIAPAAFPLGLLDVLVTGISPALLVALAVNNDRYWRFTVAIYAVLAAFCFLFPFYIPGALAGFAQPPEPLHFLLGALYWLIPLVVVATRFGREVVPNWVRSKDRKQKYFGIFVSIFCGLLIWWILWTRPYWYLFRYPAALGIATFISYSWWVPTLSLITTAITIPILEALERSDLARVQRALW